MPYSNSARQPQQPKRIANFIRLPLGLTFIVAPMLMPACGSDAKSSASRDTQEEAAGTGGSATASNGGSPSSSECVSCRASLCSDEDSACESDPNCEATLSCILDAWPSTAITACVQDVEPNTATLALDVYACLVSECIDECFDLESLEAADPEDSADDTTDTEPEVETPPTLTLEEIVIDTDHSAFGMLLGCTALALVTYEGGYHSGAPDTSGLPLDDCPGCWEEVDFEDGWVVCSATTGVGPCILGFLYDYPLRNGTCESDTVTVGANNSEGIAFLDITFPSAQ